MIRWALKYAELGWPVLPLEPRGKAPLARLVRHGVMQATTDPAVIREWWSREPTANIGLRCVPMLVIDVDPRNGGDETWARLLAGREPITDAPMVGTPSGGWHLYFGPTEGPTVAHLGRGIDVQSGARYVVAPPSVHPSGGVYRWQRSPRGGLARLPPWLASELRPEAEEPSRPRPVAASPSSVAVIDRASRYLERAEPAVQGQRGSVVLSRVAAALVRGFDLDQATALGLIDAWNRRCLPPWSDAELRRALGRAQHMPASTGSGRRPIGWGDLLTAPR